jgi:hypothetical protein
VPHKIASGQPESTASTKPNDMVAAIMSLELRGCGIHAV